MPFPTSLSDPVAGGFSPNFSWGEVVAAATPQESADLLSALKGDTVALENAVLFAEYVLQPIRNEVGWIRVTSWYRTPTHNAAVGGSPTSLHLLAAAADIEALEVSQTKLLEVCEKYRGRLEEIITYEDGHIHVGMAKSFTLGKVLVKREGGYSTLESAQNVTRFGVLAALAGLTYLASRI